jgi:hypothetical protein
MGKLSSTLSVAIIPIVTVGCGGFYAPEKNILVDNKVKEKGSYGVPPETETRKIRNSSP